MSMIFGFLVLAFGIIALLFPQKLTKLTLSWYRLRANLFRKTPVVGPITEYVKESYDLFLPSLMRWFGIAALIVGIATVLDTYDENILNDIFNRFYKP